MPKKQFAVIMLLVFAMLLASCTVVMPDGGSADESVVSAETPSKADESTESSESSDTPSADSASSEGQPSQDEPSQGEPSQDEPSQDEPSQDEPSQGETSDTPVISTPREKLVHVYLTPKGEITKEEYVGCTIRIVDPTGKYKTVNDAAARIKIRGNSTSSGAKKPYNIKFSAKTDVLGMGECKKWYLIANMYDKSLIRDKLAYDFASDIGMAYVQQSTFCEVYINGNYAGNYQICESIGVGESRVDIDITKNEFLLEYEPWEGYSNPECISSPVYGILLGFNDPEAPTPAQRRWLRDLLGKAERALQTSDRDEIAKYFDIESFIDDYIVHEYFKCVDAQTSSTRYYVKDGKIYGGPVWDFDLSAGNADKSYYTTYYDKKGNSYTGWWCRHLWYKYLFRTDWFEDEVKARFAELQPVIVNLYQDNSLGTCRIDSIVSEFGEGFDANYRKWNIYSKDSDYECHPVGNYYSCIKYLKDWLRERNNWMMREWGIN